MLVKLPEHQCSGAAATHSSKMCHVNKVPWCAHDLTCWTTANLQYHS